MDTSQGVNRLKQKRNSSEVWAAFLHKLTVQQGGTGTTLDQFRERSPLEKSYEICLKESMLYFINVSPEQGFQRPELCLGV